MRHTLGLDACLVCAESQCSELDGQERTQFVDMIIGSYRKLPLSLKLQVLEKSLYDLSIPITACLVDVFLSVFFKRDACRRSCENSR